MNDLLKKILKTIINKISNEFFSNPVLNRKLDDIKIQNGELFSFFLKSHLTKIKSLDDISFKIFSQNNEDGILEYLINSLKLHRIKFVEIGTQDYSESNTRYIYEKFGCDGLIIDNTKNLKKKIHLMMN